jgi:hypothetical protein
LIKPGLSAQGGDGFAGDAAGGAPMAAIPPAPPIEALPANFDDAHEQLLNDQRLQFEFGSVQQPELTETPGWIRALGDFFQAIAPFLVYVFWAGVALLVLLVLYIIVTEVVRRWPRRGTKQAHAAADVEAAKPEYKPAMTRARALLEEADRLAAEGRYGEAARVLLHRSIEDIERAFSLAIGPGLTSREIGAIEPLSAQGRAVFAGIARAVEMSLFGERALSAEEFARCRESYAAFALQGGKR